MAAMRRRAAGTVDPDRLAAEVTRLPVQPRAAMRLLWMLDDPATTAADLGRVIESDPSLSARILRLANSPAYGRGGEVASAFRAVTVVGLGAVRTLATAAAFDLFAGDGHHVPEGYWSHTITTAAAASVLAPGAGVRSDDALSAAVLHDIGYALAYRRGPRRYEEAVLARVAREPGLSVLDAERDEFEATHAGIGAAALSTMRFPRALVDAVARHHDDPHSVHNPLARVVIAADALAAALEDGIPGCEHTPLGPALDALAIPPSGADALAESVRAGRGHLAAFLGAH